MKKLSKHTPGQIAAKLDKAEQLTASGFLRPTSPARLKSAEPTLYC